MVSKTIQDVAPACLSLPSLSPSLLFCFLFLDHLLVLLVSGAQGSLSSCHALPYSLHIHHLSLLSANGSSLGTPSLSTLSQTAPPQVALSYIILSP